MTSLLLPLQTSAPTIEVGCSIKANSSKGEGAKSRVYRSREELRSPDRRTDHRIQYRRSAESEHAHGTDLFVLHDLV